MARTSESMKCPMCGGPPFLLGTLGSTTWLRCRNCGADFMASAKKAGKGRRRAPRPPFLNPSAGMIPITSRMPAGMMPPPPLAQNPGDEVLRSLERDVAAGDEGAAQQLVVEWRRRGMVAPQITPAEFRRAVALRREYASLAKSLPQTGGFTVGGQALSAGGATAHRRMAEIQQELWAMGAPGVQPIQQHEYDSAGRLRRKPVLGRILPNPLIGGCWYCQGPVFGEHCGACGADQKQNPHGLTPAKARQILHDRSVRGHPLTEAQRGYFGAVASGYPTYANAEGSALEAPAPAAPAPAGNPPPPIQPGPTAAPLAHGGGSYFGPVVVNPTPGCPLSLHEQVAAALLEAKPKTARSVITVVRRVLRACK